MLPWIGSIRQISSIPSLSGVEKGVDDNQAQLPDKQSAHLVDQHSHNPALFSNVPPVG